MGQTEEPCAHQIYLCTTIIQEVGADMMLSCNCGLWRPKRSTGVKARDGEQEPRWDEGGGVSWGLCLARITPLMWMNTGTEHWHSKCKKKDLRELVCSILSGFEASPEPLPQRQTKDWRYHPQRALHFLVQQNSLLSPDSWDIVDIHKNLRLLSSFVKVSKWFYHPNCMPCQKLSVPLALLLLSFLGWR